MALLIVVFVEALRFIDIADTVVSGWEYGKNLSLDQAKYIMKWKEMSCALIIAVQNNGQWGINDDTEVLRVEANIDSMERAEHIIGLILRPNSCSEPFNWL
jgi:hypothetical protein